MKFILATISFAVIFGLIGWVIWPFFLVIFNAFSLSPETINVIRFVVGWTFGTISVIMAAFLSGKRKK